jgi:hypothetical protein
MKRLVLVLCIAVLAAPPIAAAKGLLGVEACGPDGCQQQRSDRLEEGAGGPNGPFTGLGGIVQPAAPGPWYRINFLLGDNGKLFMRVPLFYVPGSKLLITPGNGNEQPSWWHPRGELRTIVESLAARVKPYPTPTDIQVKANGKSVAAPQSYLRLFTIGSRTDKYPTEDDRVDVTFTSKRPTPWTTGNLMVLYPKSHLFIRDGQMVVIPADTSDRIVRRASLAPGSSFPWLPLAAGAVVVVLAAALVRRLRPRAAPRPVIQH